MKLFIGILLIFFSISAFAQFPAPTSFQYDYEYIMVGQSGECLGQWIYGPAYCSHFNWNCPNFSSTPATFKQFNLYYYSWDYNTTTLIVSTSASHYDTDDAFIGEMWVTAVYEDPDGESDPSNVVINDDLPISSVESLQRDKLAIFYGNKNQVTIINGEDISQVRIYNCQGKTVYSETQVSSKINIENLPSGLYIIEAVMNNSEVKRQKIIK